MAASSIIRTAEKDISPKVFWPLLVAIVLTFLGTALAAITPETLGGLGAFAVPVALGLQGVSMVITGYMKGDPVRDIGIEATKAVIPTTPTSQVVPDEVDPEDFEQDGTSAELDTEIAHLDEPGSAKHRA